MFEISIFDFVYVYCCLLFVYVYAYDGQALVSIDIIFHLLSGSLDYN